MTATSHPSPSPNLHFMESILPHCLYHLNLHVASHLSILVMVFMLRFYDYYYVLKPVIVTNKSKNVLHCRIRGLRPYYCDPEQRHRDSTDLAVVVGRAQNQLLRPTRFSPPAHQPSLLLQHRSSLVSASVSSRCCSLALASLF